MVVDAPHYLLSVLDVADSGLEQVSRQRSHSMEPRCRSCYDSDAREVARKKTYIFPICLPSDFADLRIKGAPMQIAISLRVCVSQLTLLVFALIPRSQSGSGGLCNHHYDELHPPKPKPKPMFVPSHSAHRSH